MTTKRPSIDIGAEKDFLKEKPLKIGSLDAGDEEPGWIQSLAYLPHETIALELEVYMIDDFYVDFTTVNDDLYDEESGLFSLRRQ